MAAYDQVQPDEEFEVLRAEALLHGQPQLLVDPLTPLGQKHENVIAQQVALAEPDTRVVDRLEDPVDVVPGLGGDLHDREQVLENGFDGPDPPLVAGLLAPGERTAEEPVGRTDVVAPAGLGPGLNASGVCLPVRLRGQQPIMVEPLVELVDQYLPVHPVDAARIAGLPEMVA